MVLTQPEVTIESDAVVLKFPYHYGSYATSKDWKEISKLFSVSIPLWFLRNSNGEVSFISNTPRFPYHYGSYATEACRTGTDKFDAFPYHYGSYATFLVGDSKYKMGECFHTTMVLTQRIPGEPHSPETPFPYHYGSYATAFITKILYRFWAGGIK